MILVFAAVACGQDPPPDLEPRSATLKGPKLKLSTALTELGRQTGNTVHDRRRQPSNPDLPVPAPGPFWPTLDALAKSGEFTVSPYGADGGVAITDAPYRALPTAYSGLFRLTLKRVAVTRDFEAETHRCLLGLDVAWEPRFRPFYLDAGTATVTYADKRRESIDQRSQIAVAGRNATEVELRFPAPDRAVPKIATLEGTLRVIGPTRMLDFAFKKLTPSAVGQAAPTQTQDGVTVTLSKIATNAKVWSVDVVIENPPGGPALESFQSWLDNNRLSLVWGEGERAVVWASTEEQVSQVTSRRAVVRYHLPLENNKRIPPGGLGAATLHYTTPARVVQISAPYRFQDVPLP